MNEIGPSRARSRDRRIARAGGLVAVATVLWMTAGGAAPAASATAKSIAGGELRGSVAAKTDETADLALSGWSIGGDADRTVVAFDLSQPVKLRVFALGEPSRVVIDLPEARFDAAKAGARGAGGLIEGWRFGAFAAGRSRLVIDTRGPVRVAAATAQPTGANGGGMRLVVDLVPADRDDARRVAPIDVDPTARSGATAPTDATGTAIRAASKGDRQKAVPPPSGRRPVIVVDAGHGGIDAGTVSPATGTPEKTVVLAMAKTLAERLASSGRYDVSLTRTDDDFLALGERVRIARARHADLFVSIHADAEYDHSVRGATIYTLAEKASDEQAAALAVKENQSDALAGHVVEEAEPEVAGILAELTLRETRRLSHGFARDLLDEYRRHGRLVKTQPHRQAGLKVLRAHDIPSVLVEIGFLSNKEDEALMTSADWRARTAESLAAAVDRYFAGRSALAEPTNDSAAASP